MSTKNQFVTDAGGKTVGIGLPLKDYGKMPDELDEYACIKAYDKVKARKIEFVPAENMFEADEQKRKRN